MLDTISNLGPHDLVPLHPDIWQSLSGLEKPLQTEVSECLQRVFQETDAWQGSALTGDGFPFEACFHTGKDTFYWTADPAFGKSGPEQLAQISRTAARLGDSVAHPIAADLPRLAPPFRAGSWLGGRHDVGKPVSCKLYTDWSDPTLSRAIFPDLTLPERLPNGVRAQLRGLGLGPGPSRAETYYRFKYATARHMHHILEFAGLSAQSSAARAQASEYAAGPLDRSLERSGMIASLSQDTPGSTVSVTFYFFPRSFWGNDRVCRIQFLSLLGKCQRNTAPYAAASEALAERVHYNLFHGLIALTVTPDGMAWGCGVRPLCAGIDSKHPIISKGASDG